MSFAHSATYGSDGGKYLTVTVEHRLTLADLEFALASSPTDTGKTFGTRELQQIIEDEIANRGLPSLAYWDERSWDDNIDARRQWAKEAINKHFAKRF